MNNDRPVDLAFGFARQGLGKDHGAGAGPDSRRQARQEDQGAFERALAETPAQAAPASMPLGSPFALLGGASVPPAPAARADLDREVRQTVKHLLVSDQDSAGPRTVRMDLADEFMEGVTVSVFEEGGVLTATFGCESSQAQARAASLAPRLAEALAASLGRDCLICVLDGKGVDLHPGYWRAGGHA